MTTQVKPIKASVSFTKTAPAEIVSRASAVYAGMDNNPAYTNPPVDIPTFKAAIDGLQAKIASALDGGKQALLERNRQGEVVIKMLRQLAHYVETNCKDDMTIFTSSGFKAVTTVRTATTPLSQSIRKIDPGSNSGELLVSLVAVLGALSYELRWAAVPVGGTPTAWTSNLVPSTRPPVSITSLTPGTTYAFQVRVLTKAGFSDWSDSITKMST